MLRFFKEGEEKLHYELLTPTILPPPGFEVLNGGEFAVEGKSCGHV